jgi:hypothetical protein
MLLVGKSEGKRPFGRSQCTGIDIIKMDLGKTEWGGMGWGGMGWAGLVWLRRGSIGGLLSMS